MSIPRSIPFRPRPVSSSTTPPVWPSTSPTTWSGLRWPSGSPKGSTTKRPSAPNGRKKYPLLVMSNHPRWGVHSEHDDITWLREIETCKVRGADGYQYQPLWINPVDAKARGIKKGDVCLDHQRPGHGPGRRLRHRAHHARYGRHRPRGQVGPHRSRGDRPGWGHQQHRARGTPPPRTPPATPSAASWPKWRRPIWKLLGPNTRKPLPVPSIPVPVRA